MENSDFTLPPDGFFQITPKGRFPLKDENQNIIQVIDEKAISAMANRFNAEAKQPGFSGLLIDFDHFSHDQSQSSAAAGWITSLEARNDGLYAKARWSNRGLQAVSGGEYRNVSPTWLPSDCEEVAPGEIRPLRLHNVGLTNSPNLKGMKPISNRSNPSSTILNMNDDLDAKHLALVNRLKLDRKTSFNEAWTRSQTEDPELWMAVCNRNAARPICNQTRPSEAFRNTQAHVSIVHQPNSGNRNDPYFEGANAYDSLLQTMTSVLGSKEQAAIWIQSNRPELHDAICAYYGL